MKRLFITLILFVALFSSCSIVRFARFYASADDQKGRLTGQVYESKFTSYEIGSLSDSWERIKIEGGDIAFWNSKVGATITVNSTCNQKGKYSLKALSEPLVIGIADKRMLGRNELSIDSEKALESIYLGRLDSASIKLSTVVLKKGSCVYDLTYASSPDNFARGFGDFKEFISKFRVIK
ncbi:MAG: hypothetical protein C4291_11290 [Candidatus Dadabacteria bacterium]